MNCGDKVNTAPGLMELTGQTEEQALIVQSHKNTRAHSMGQFRGAVGQPTWVWCGLEHW